MQTIDLFDPEPDAIPSTYEALATCTNCRESYIVRQKQGRRLPFGHGLTCPHCGCEGAVVGTSAQAERAKNGDIRWLAIRY